MTGEVDIHNWRDTPEWYQSISCKFFFSNGDGNRMRSPKDDGRDHGTR